MKQNQILKSTHDSSRCDDSSAARPTPSPSNLATARVSSSCQFTMDILPSANAYGLSEPESEAKSDSTRD
jgi:hypothetical protein